MTVEASGGMDRHPESQSDRETDSVPFSDRAGRRVLALLFLATGVTASAAAAVVPVLITGDATQPLVQEEGALLAGLVAGAVAWLWFAVHKCLLHPVGRLASDVYALAANTGAPPHIDGDDYPDLEPLPEAINALADRLVTTRRDIEQAIADSNHRLTEQNNRLTAILRDLNEGVLVCSLSHQIVTWNQAALNLLQVNVGSGGFGPGRDLFSLMLAEPVRHTLERLTHQTDAETRQAIGDEDGARFIGGTPDGRILLDGRMSLIFRFDPDTGTDAGTTAEKTVSGYVLTFTDATRELAALGRRDALLRATTEELRVPLANLRAVMETLADCTDQESPERPRLEDAMRLECDDLTMRLERIADQYRTTITGHWPMTDLRSQTLIELIQHRVASRQSITISATGIPCRFHGDSFSLVILLDHLIARVGPMNGDAVFELSSEAAARWIFVDLLWTGNPVPSAVIDQWKAEPLTAALGGLTVGDVLRHHRSDLWSDSHADGRARLRLPLPPALAPAPVRARTAPTPDFADIAVLRQTLAPGDLKTARLDSLTFVVFDAEIFGVRPEDGGEMVAIAAVRVVNRRILTTEPFQVLITPRHHDLTGHDIAGETVRPPPDLSIVLPQFRAFAEGAVLVAHDAASDIRFLRARERACGVRFDNPILDTMLLSFCLHGPSADHSLDGLTHRLGIAAIDRHTALGDCLTTAAVLIALIGLLHDRGITTLGDLVREVNAAIEHQAKEHVF